MTPFRQKLTFRAAWQEWIFVIFSQGKLILVFNFISESRSSLMSNQQYIPNIPSPTGTPRSQTQVCRWGLIWNVPPGRHLGASRPRRPRSGTFFSSKSLLILIIGYYKSHATMKTWFQVVADPKNTNLGVIFSDFHVQRHMSESEGCPKKPFKTATSQFLTFEPESRLNQHNKTVKTS